MPVAELRVSNVELIELFGAFFKKMMLTPTVSVSSSKTDNNTGMGTKENIKLTGMKNLFTSDFGLVSKARPLLHSPS